MSGKELIALAVAISAELSCGQDANEILAISDLTGMITSNLIAIANRTLYITDPAGTCQKNKKALNKKDTCAEVSSNTN